MNWNDPQRLWIELVAATEYNRRFLGVNYDEDRKRYAGIGFRDDWSNEDPDLENHAFEWFSLFAGAVLAGNPKVKVSTPRSGHMRDLVRAAGYAINRNIVDTNAVALNEACLYDWGFRWAVALTLQEPAPGDYSDFADPPHRPRSKRISPTHYVSDPVSLWQDEDRFRGHGMVRDKADLIKEAEEDGSWNLALIKALPEEIGVDDMRRSTSRSTGTAARGEVTLYELWVPEVRLPKAFDENGEEFEPAPEDGYNGTIFTVPHGGGGDAREALEKLLAQGEHIRRPRPFYGPPEGPYTVSGAYMVPDENRHLSPLAAVAAQTDELNTHRRAMSRRMSEYKRGLAVDTTRLADLAQTLTEFEDSHVFGVEGVEDIQKVLKQIEVSGLSDQDLAHYQFLRDAVQRATGTTDAERGQLDKDVKATVALIGNQSSNRRAGHLERTFANTFVLGYIRKEAWYILRDERTGKRLGAEASMLFLDPTTGEPIEDAVWMGGDVHPEDVEMKIDLFSMSQTTEEQQAFQAQQVDQLVLSMMPLVRKFPEWDWEGYFQYRGEQLEVPQLSRWMNYDKARQMGAIEMMLAGVQGDTTPAHKPASTPRLPMDVAPGSIPMPGISGTGGAQQPQAAKAGQAPSVQEAVA